MELTTLTFNLVQELSDFSYELSSLDRVWNILFPCNGQNWNYLHVSKYKRTFYITHIDSGGSLEVETEKGVRAMDPMGASSYSVENHGQLTTVWKTLIESARKWLKVTR